MTEISDKTNFIRQIVDEDLATGKHQKIITRFPPEPNGYLHIGHAKSICLNFGLALAYDGACHLRFDDTNPETEEEEYVNAIQEDVTWLGFEWDRLCYASDYYEDLYRLAEYLIDNGHAYVDELPMEQIRAYRGTLTERGKNSPYRDRPIEENQQLFKQMRAGKHPDGSMVLRAKVDMNSGNMNMRDPVLYRIRHATHQRTGDTWCIYPMYDYAHPISDAIESITHSLCTLEFQDHRPLYDWLVNILPLDDKPRQIEFARLNLSHTITSKRKLKELVEKGLVSGWDDPRLPTIKGMRERGYPPKALREFCNEISISKSDSVIDMTLLEECVRHELNQTAPRAMCVLDPLKIVIENYSETETQWLETAYFQKSDDISSRLVPFAREIYIERSDFMENPPKDFHRLTVGKEVRLRHAYVIRCDEVIKNDAGEIVELRCSYDKETLGKNPEGRKVKGVIHWVSALQAEEVEIYHYERLFLDENPARDDDFCKFLNPDSLIIQKGWIEPALAIEDRFDVFQFERLGYFKINTCSEGKNTVFHKVVSLRDTWNGA